MCHPVRVGGLSTNALCLAGAVATGFLWASAPTVRAADKSTDVTVSVDATVDVDAADVKPVEAEPESDEANATPAKPGKGTAAARGRSKKAASPGRSTTRRSAGRGTGVSGRTAFSGGSMGGGRCGPASLASQLNGASGMSGFNLLASIGVQANYGGGQSGGGASNGGSTGGAKAGCTEVAAAGSETEIDITVRVRLNLGSGSGKKECHKDGQQASTSTGNNSDTTDSTTTTDSAANGLEGRILAFAQAKLGTQVGNGECWTLAAEALKAADAEPPLQYVFGREVATADVRPGMVLQFESARFEGPGYYAVYGAPNHTAIVASVRGSTVRILHQNVNGDRTVQYGELQLDHLVSGSMIVYQPLPKGTSLLNSVR
jgi:hypothetical protein